ncbi:hypothetical protein KFE25_006727 [Diacronema lutheri]|uniref:RING-CH-type domain-containing protein n=1 Tax=Diacronema lutheri TaxID=2081491 RepID=A0A8J6CF63_DIALT|nr:hypothetical protein KFE25_006727 [Diacronema lutheri]
MVSAGAVMHATPRDAPSDAEMSAAKEGVAAPAPPPLDIEARGAGADGAVRTVALGEGAADDCADHLKCYVCFEDEGAPPLANTCGCTSAVIHAHCLEKMLNSKKMREKALPERTSCAVCTRRFTVELVAYVADEQRPNRLSVFARTPLGSIVVPLSTVCGVLSLVALMIYVLGRYTALLVMVGVTVFLWPVCAVRSIRARRSNTNLMDDNAYFDKAVAHARKEVQRGHHASLESAAAARPDKVVLIVPSGGTSTREAPPSLPPASAQPPDAGAAAAEAPAPPPPPSATAAGAQAPAAAPPPAHAGAAREVAPAEQLAAEEHAAVATDARAQASPSARLNSVVVHVLASQ